ncbi:hypothetical protein EJB05_56183, partial [Eragrostis curvula]
MEYKSVFRILVSKKYQRQVIRLKLMKFCLVIRFHGELNPGLLDDTQVIELDGNTAKENKKTCIIL